MKKLIEVKVSLFFVALLFALTSIIPLYASGSSSQSSAVASVAEVTSSSVIYWCSDKGFPIPDGYVVVGATTDYRCPGSYNYRWRLEPAVSGMWACLGSTYPSPYFITMETSNTGGGGYACEDFLGKMQLTLPSNGLMVCVNGAMWSPWVVTANGHSYKCDGYATLTIHQPQEGLRICSNSVIPDGWYADNASQFYLCQPYLTETLHKSSPANTSMTKGTSVPMYVQQGNTAVVRRKHVSTKGN